MPCPTIVFHLRKKQNPKINMLIRPRIICSSPTLLISFKLFSIVLFIMGSSTLFFVLKRHHGSVWPTSQVCLRLPWRKSSLVSGKSYSNCCWMEKKKMNFLDLALLLVLLVYPLASRHLSKLLLNYSVVYTQ